MPASTVMMPDLTKSPVVCVRKMEHEEGGQGGQGGN